MAKDFTVTIANPERVAEWQQVFGTTTLCVKSPVSQRNSLPGHPDAEVYFLDLDMIYEEQRQRLIDHIANKFKIDRIEVEYLLADHGVPILADDCLLTIHNPQKWI